MFHFPIFASTTEIVLNNNATFEEFNRKKWLNHLVLSHDNYIKNITSNTSKVKKSFNIPLLLSYLLNNFGKICKNLLLTSSLSSKDLVDLSHKFRDTGGRIIEENKWDPCPFGGLTFLFVFSHHAGLIF